MHERVHPCAWQPIREKTLPWIGLRNISRTFQQLVFDYFKTLSVIAAIDSERPAANAPWKTLKLPYDKKPRSWFLVGNLEIYATHYFEPEPEKGHLFTDY